MFRILERLKPRLRTQIALLGIVGVMITGVISVAGLNHAVRIQDEADQSAHFRALLASLAEGFLESQQIAMDFLRKRDVALIGKHGESVNEQMAELQQIEALSANMPDGDPLKDVTFLRTGIGLYATRFNNIVSAQRTLGLNENDGLQGKLRNAVHDLEARLAKFDQPRLSVLVLMMRRHEKDFMLRREEKYGDELEKRVSEFTSALQTSDLPPDARGEMKKLVDAYRSGFMAYMVTQQALDDQVDDLGQIFARNRPLLTKAHEAAVARATAAEERAAHFRQTLTWTLGMATLAIGFLAVLIGQRLAKLLARMTGAMRQLAAGQFDVVLPGLRRSDEIGDMAQAVEVFKVKVQERAHAELAAKMEQEHQAERKRKGELTKLAHMLETAVSGVIDTLSSASKELEASARGLTEAACDTQEFSTKVASASDEASTNVQIVATASEQMRAAALEIGRQVEQSAIISKEAEQQAEQTDHRMKRLSDAALKVGNVVELITAIAQQTNLLALNATIEAARAGDAGRGFAVVAQEVKSLATQTAKATTEIGEQIADIQAATKESTDAIAGIGESIGRISRIASTVAASIEEQAAATREIAQNTNHAAEMTTQVAGNIRQVAAGASKAGEASSRVLTSAKLLAQSSDHLKAEVNSFLAGIRAA